MVELIARSQTRATQKGGNAAAEYEDAWARDDGRGRFAIADGASDAYDSGRWARLLAESFVAGEASINGRDELSGWVDWLAQKWRAQIDWEELSAPRNWYKHEKASLGDFATFLGLEIELQARHSGDDSQPNVLGDVRWRALAVGDTCLFHVRANSLLAPSFPIAARSDFDMTPRLISTQKQYNRRSLEALQFAKGTCQPGDSFFLATDALACSLLTACEQGEQPWSQLGCVTEAAFDQLVARLRRRGYLRNDDVTLLIVQIDAANEEAGDSKLNGCNGLERRSPEVLATSVSPTPSTTSGAGGNSMMMQPVSRRDAGQPRKRSSRGATDRLRRSTSSE